MKRTIEEWITYGKGRHRYIFFFEERVLDLTDFIPQHPGGKKAIINYLGKDVSSILFNVYPHNRDTTLKVLQKYVVGQIPEDEVTKRVKNDKNINKKGMSPAKEKKRVCFKRKTFLVEDDCDSQQSNPSKIFQKKQNECQNQAAKNIISKSEIKKDTPFKQEKNIEKNTETVNEEIKEKQNENSKKTHQKSKRKHKNKQIQEIDIGDLNNELDEQKFETMLPLMSIHFINKM